MGPPLNISDLTLSNKGSLGTSTEAMNALAFLQEGNTHQLMRKEIQYGLMPTTLKGLSLVFLVFIF